jgi:hypothetical protein
VEYGETYGIILDLARRQSLTPRVFACTSIILSDSNDWTSLQHTSKIWSSRLAHRDSYRSIQAIGKVFAKHGQDVDWRLFRIAELTGGSHKESWQQHREDTKAFVGRVGDPAWKPSQKCAALTRWLVDQVEDEQPCRTSRMPAVVLSPPIKGQNTERRVDSVVTYTSDEGYAVVADARNPIRLQRRANAVVTAA